jgi:hypothetical protein
LRYHIGFHSSENPNFHQNLKSPGEGLVPKRDCV